MTDQHILRLLLGERERECTHGRHEGECEDDAGKQRQRQSRQRFDACGVIWTYVSASDSPRRKSQTSMDTGCRGTANARSEHEDRKNGIAVSGCAIIIGNQHVVVTPLRIGGDGSDIILDIGFPQEVFRAKHERE